MKSRFPFLKKMKSPYRFEVAPLRESSRYLCNPGCGWYRIFPFHLEEEPDLAEADYSLVETDSLVLVLLCIGAYQGKELDEAALSRMRRILSFFVKKGKEIILRVAYDVEGRGLEREPGMFSLVLTHIRQLGPVVREFEDDIYVYQGFLVGSWGEMHGSKFLSPKYLKQLKDVIRESFGEKISLAVRRPMYYRMLFAKINPLAKIGLFDDGMFGSDTHLGTFGVNSKNQAGWENLWKPEEELEFSEELGHYAPCGGEAIYDAAKKGRIDLAETAAVLRKMRVAYLNRAHDTRLLENWKNQLWEEKKGNIWNGMDGFAYIGRHLGYRFRVCQAVGHFTVDEEGETSMLLRVTVSNDGFSFCYEDCEFVLEGETGWSKRIAVNLLEIPPGEARTVETMITPEGERLYLSLRRNRDSRFLELANEFGTGEWVSNDNRICIGKVVSTSL